ncbi:Adenylosuccinate synthetase [Pseudobythopirellula maris]|uniref:Adenylosuccinate synthetase n=1 Tax=Pseudobythopirellula maris TaxID=2527991 RepID=A0A5C5ZMP0_9BACT|nr:adenylosuccinate synthase [Pseudobythopirellula maris]TWT88366.1 Adenylosuccinate synthetase [Pseudobythopirellula maris]
MPGACVIGLQWGDEAKGKIVDLLTPRHDFVVRYQGGANAGHTVVVGKEVYKLSLLPSGVLTPGVTSVIAGGVVINPVKAIEELDELAGRGVEGLDKNLKISGRAHVIFPWHFAEDRALDANTSDGENIGTTQRGIGPCYRDKVARSHAIRFDDLYRDDLAQRIAHIVAEKNVVLAAIDKSGTFEPLDPAAIYEEYRGYAERLKSHLCDTTTMLLDAAEAGKKILFEGAQGALLDVDHGTYPFVTSSNSSGVGICNGSGLPARYVNHTLGVVKAYSTRVGGGPFPTEQDNDQGQQLRDQGNEYGTVTKRPRRCGWLDTVAVRYTARLGGADAIAVMLLDVLSGFDEIKICNAYELDGEQTRNFPSHVDDVRRVKPIYESLPGWSEDLTACKSIDELPANARGYLDRVAELVERPVELVSVGPGRDQSILVGDPPLLYEAIG